MKCVGLGRVRGLALAGVGVVCGILCLGTSFAGPPCSPRPVFPPRSACWSGPVIVRSWNCSPYWGWNNWNGWNSWYVGPEIFSVTYGDPAPGFSSGFGTISVPGTRIHKVPPPVKLTEPLVIHEGTSFGWKR